MDTTLLLLMHTLHGLKIDPSEELAILKCDSNHPRDLEGCLQSGAARAYLAKTPEWLSRSLQQLELGHINSVQWSRLGDENYPLEWLSLSKRPLVFSFQGPASWKTTPFLAVVGSRTPMTDSLMWMQRELGLFLRRRHVGIVSGGARGIDQWAHRICIDEERPTVCVLPSGLLSPYPPGNEVFWSAVLEGGGSLISTFALREPMRKSAFHVRNRWITGMSPLLFVVEANRRSGSAMTANLAREENRGICTLPLFPHSEQGLANLDIISDGHTMLRDHLDLGAAWESYSHPTLFERAQGKEEKQGIDHP
jgi:DNA processing protein